MGHKEEFTLGTEQHKLRAGGGTKITESNNHSINEQLFESTRADLDVQ